MLLSRLSADDSLMKADHPEFVKSNFSLSTDFLRFFGITTLVQDPGVFRQPMALSQEVFPETERDELLARSIELILKRYRINHPKNTVPAVDRMNNPLIALQSAPGVGKSYALTLISRLGLSAQKIARLKEKGLLPEITPDDEALISRCLGITITFNSGFGPRKAETKENWDEFFGWRIIYSYFSAIHRAKGQSLLLYNEMIDQFRPTLKMSSRRALNIVIAHQASLLAASPCPSGKQVEPHILLCVDEMAKCINAPQLVRTLCDIIDSDPRIDVFTSTLDKYYSESGEKLFLIETGSGRSVEWLPLPRLSLSGVLSLFKEYEPLQNPKLYTTLCAASGHARSLRMILDVILSIPKTSLQDLSFEKLSPGVSQLTWQMISKAFRGDQVPINDESVFTLDKKAISLRQLIADGYFINTHSYSGNSDEMSIPTLSLLRLYTNYLSLPGRNYNILKPFWNLMFLIPPIRNIDAGIIGLWFETFHINWEIIRRIVLLDELDQPKTVSLVKDVYNIQALSSFSEEADLDEEPTFDSSPLSQAKKAEGSRQQSVWICGKDHKFTINPSPINQLKSVIRKTNANFKMPLNTAYHFGGVNEGFDHLLFEMTDEGPISIFIECKFSSPDSQSPSSFSYLSIRNKISATLQFYNKNIVGNEILQARLGGQFKDLSQACFVIASMQSISDKSLSHLSGEIDDLSRGVAMSVKDKKGVDQVSLFPNFVPGERNPVPTIVILREAHLKELYSPSLDYVPTFYPHDEIA